MSLQDDFFELDAELDGHQKRRMRRIWKAFCEIERELDAAKDCVRLVNLARRFLADKPPIT